MRSKDQFELNVWMHRNCNYLFFQTRIVQIFLILPEVLEKKHKCRIKNILNALLD